MTLSHWLSKNCPAKFRSNLAYGGLAMFYAGIIFVLALIALVAGASLIFKTKFHKEVPAGPCSFIGYAVIVLSTIVILFSGYGMFRGYFMHRTMMRKMMPMMQKMMKDKMPMQQRMQPGSSQHHPMLPKPKMDVKK
jgi:hypothetical protein